MVTVLDIFALAVLVFVAAELHVISRTISRFIRALPAERELKEGQTINVNLGQIPQVVPLPEAPRVEVPEVSTTTVPEAVQEGASELAPAPEMPRPVPAFGAKLTTSGILVVKCPTCQTENSNYRHECFNCGNRL